MLAVTVAEPRQQRPAAEGISVMQRVNSTILNPLFGLTFGAIMLRCLVVVVTAPFTTDQSHATLRGIGSAPMR